VHAGEKRNLREHALNTIKHKQTASPVKAPSLSTAVHCTFHHGSNQLIHIISGLCCVVSSFEFAMHFFSFKYSLSNVVARIALGVGFYLCFEIFLHCMKYAHWSALVLNTQEGFTKWSSCLLGHPKIQRVSRGLS
jgi:hypothetical protein